MVTAYFTLSGVNCKPFVLALIDVVQVQTEFLAEPPFSASLSFGDGSRIALESLYMLILTARCQEMSLDGV